MHGTLKITELRNQQTAVQGPVKAGCLVDMPLGFVLFFYKVTPCVTMSDTGSQTPQAEQETVLFEKKSAPSKPGTVLASCGRSNKSPETEQLQTTEETYSLKILERRHPNPGVGRAGCL